MTRKNHRPAEYVVYTDVPAYPRTGCQIRVKKIPRGQTFNDVRDSLPPTVGRLAVVSATSAGTAKAGAGQRGVRCAPPFAGARRARKRRL